MIAERETFKLQNESLNQWWLLPGTGFDVKGQVNKLKREGNLESWLEQTREDINGFGLEYLARLPVLPINIEFSEGEQKRIVGSKYANQLWVETASIQERGGTVRNSLEQTEEILASAHRGSVVVLTSPPGWSGYEGIAYPDSQTYVFKIDEQGKLDAITIVSDMDLVQSEKLLELFEVYVGGGSEEDRIKKIVSNLVFLDGNQKHYDFEDVLLEIKNVLKTEYLRGENTFSEARELIKQRKELGNLMENSNDIVNKILERFEESARFATTFEEIEFELGKAILDLTDALVIEKSDEYDYEFDQGEDFYSQRLGILQQIGGCNGGGVISTPFGVRKIEGSGQILCCKCPFCKKEVKAEIKGGRIHCPKCKANSIYKSLN